MTFRSITFWALKIFGIACWALWGGFTLGMTAVTMWQVLKGNAPFFQGAFYAGICGLGIGFILSYTPRRIIWKRECQIAAKSILGSWKDAIVHTHKIREKIKAEFDLMVKKLMEGDPDTAAVHQKNLQNLQENFEAVWSEHFSLFDKEKKDEPKAST